MTIASAVANAGASFGAMHNLLDLDYHYLKDMTVAELEFTLARFEPALRESRRWYRWLYWRNRGSMVGVVVLFVGSLFLIGAGLVHLIGAERTIGWLGSSICIVYLLAAIPSFNRFQKQYEAWQQEEDVARRDYHGHASIVRVTTQLLKEKEGR